MLPAEKAVLIHSTLFSECSAEEIAQLCTVLHAMERHYAKGSFLIRAGDALPAFGLLLSGSVQVFMDDLDGNRILMADVSPGSTFAEAMACSGVAESPISAVAVQESSILWFYANLLMEPTFFADPLCARFATNFIRTMATRSLRFNDRIQVLSKKSIREKLITFFSQQMHYQRSRQIVLSMDRSALADYLGVDRTALSRELSHMRKDNILSFHKNHFTIHHNQTAETSTF